MPRGAKEAERETKVACWYVVGEVMKELGANVSLPRPFPPAFFSDCSPRAQRAYGSEADHTFVLFHASQNMSFMSDICLSALKLLKANAQVSFALPSFSLLLLFLGPRSRT